MYSAIPFSDPSQSVAIKLIERSRLDYEDVLAFQREAALMSRLRHPNIISFHELGLYRPENQSASQVASGYYIVMEVAQGHDLKESLIKGGRKRLDFFFELGLQVSAALEYTHAKNIIHRDIKPQNIIIERSNDSEGGLLVKVLDFGIARLGDLDLYSDENVAADIAGTPLYMAPETSKFLDAPIDHRVDLYSLGCVLYEVLAGKPPFSGATRDKLAREHAHAQPESLTSIRPDIPDVVNDIVLKLMAKHPKDRYQTAFGLHVDLQRVRKMLGSNRSRGSRFILGRYDRLNILPSSVPMVGRQEDFDTLVANYSAITKDSGRSRVVVMRGAGGSGKTRLMKEFRGYLAKNKVRYVSTSFSRHENNMPFNALANGFNEYLVHVAKTNPVEAEEIRRKVKAFLGNDAKMVADVVQGLKPYLASEQTDLAPQASDLVIEKESVEFNSFTKAFSDFTRCLVTETEPVVLFFDDMHWADDKSIDLIDRLISHNNSQRFLLIISYRSMGIQQGSVFQHFLTKFAKLRRRYHELELIGLTSPSIADMSRSILGLNKTPDRHFVNYLHEKSAGNPLYILELHRSLVFQEMLSLDDQGRWRIELGDIARTTVSSNSIDLLLNRLSELPDEDRRILEMAAIIGTQFTSDMLEALPEVAPNKIQQVLQKSVSSGHLMLTSDASRNPTAGAPTSRTYAFMHRSIREALVDGLDYSMQREVHRLVALRLEASASNNKPLLTFSLAHHFFYAYRGSKAIDPDLVTKALDYNVKAGLKALEINSHLTAQRYLENARLTLKDIKAKSAAVVANHKQLLRALADIHFARREYNESARIYYELRGLPISANEYAFISYKLGYLSILSGNVAGTLKEMATTFRKLRFPAIRLDFPFALRLAWQLLRSAVLPIKHSMPAIALDKAVPGKASFHPLQLYITGQNASLTYDKRLAMAYHSELLQRAYTQSLPEGLVLRMICDHAIVLSYLGFQKRAYQFLEMVFEVTRQKSDQPLLGYATFQQTLFVDQYQGKLEDSRYSLQLIQTSLDNQEFQYQLMQERIFRMVLFLFSGQGEDLTKLFKTLPNMLTVRHWMTAKAVSAYLFWLLITDSRELIVNYGNFVQKRNTKRESRRGDIFYRIIEAIVSLAAGERENARSAYYNVLANFEDNLVSPLLFPYEVDFILLFLGFFPDVFSMEYGDDLWKRDELIPAFNKVLGIASHRRHRLRAVPMLLKARLMDRLEQKKVRLFYDIALKRTKITQQPLIEMLTRLWFARHLSTTRAVLRADYFGMAEETARRLNLGLISSMLRKIRKDLGLPYQKTTELVVPIPGEPLSAVDPLIAKHLHIMPRLAPESLSLEEAKKAVFDLIRQRLQLEQVYLVTAAEIRAYENQNRPPMNHAQEVIAYIFPYFTLRSSLTIPVDDAPWRQKGLAPAKGFSADSESTLVSTRHSEYNTSIEHTALIPRSEGIGDLRRYAEESSLSEANEADRTMNALVPVRYGSQNLALLFLEAARLQEEDSTALRQALDCLGAEIGAWLRAYVPNESKPELLPLLNYSQGEYQFEPCSWLHVWTEGNLRNDRESVWYLGLNLNDDSYLMVYCRLNGPQETRLGLASNLWYEVLTLRTLFAGSGRDLLTGDEVQEFLEKYIRSYPGADHLEAIAVSFSVMHRTSGEVASGHFGSARPLVLGCENQVTPLNRVVLTMSNDRSLRYWKVQTSGAQKGVFILPHDSSKLDRLDAAALKELNFESLSWEQKRWRFYDYLRQNLIDGQVPRYFVAASWNATALSTQRVG